MPQSDQETSLDSERKENLVTKTNDVYMPIYEPETEPTRTRQENFPPHQSEEKTTSWLSTSMTPTQ